MIVFTSRSDVLTRTSDGRNHQIQENIELRRDDGARFRMPAGAWTDGCSTPRELWIELPPFSPTPDKDYWLPSVIHDGAFRGTLLRETTDGLWLPANLSEEQSNLLFLDCMIAKRVEQGTREKLYDGVKLFGWKAFRDDRNPS